jgi:hypothetical protein
MRVRRRARYKIHFADTFRDGGEVALTPSVPELAKESIDVNVYTICNVTELSAIVINYNYNYWPILVQRNNSP